MDTIHLDEGDTLERLLAGTISRDDQLLIAEHVGNGCARCDAALEPVEEVDLIRGLGRIMERDLKNARDTTPPDQLEREFQAIMRRVKKGPRTSRKRTPGVHGRIDVPPDEN